MQEVAEANTEDDSRQGAEDRASDEFAGGVTDRFADAQFGSFTDDLGSCKEDLGQDDDEAGHDDEDHADGIHGTTKRVDGVADEILYQKRGALGVLHSKLFTEVSWGNTVFEVNDDIRHLEFRVDAHSACFRYHGFISEVVDLLVDAADRERDGIAGLTFDIHDIADLRVELVSLDTSQDDLVRFARSMTFQNGFVFQLGQIVVGIDGQSGEVVHEHDIDARE